MRAEGAPGRGIATATRPSIGGEFSASRSISTRPAIGKNFLSLPSFVPSISPDSGGRRANPGFKIGETKPFFRIAPEVSAKKPGKVSSESTPSRRTTHHKKISARENGGFRPISHSRPEAKSSPRLISAEKFAPPALDKGLAVGTKKSDADRGIGIQLQKARKKEAIRIEAKSPEVKVGEIQISNKNLEVKRLEIIVARAKEQVSEKKGLYLAPVRKRIEEIRRLKNPRLRPGLTLNINSWDEDEDKKRRREVENVSITQKAKVVEIPNPNRKLVLAPESYKSDSKAAEKILNQISTDTRTETETNVKEIVVFDSKTNTKNIVGEGQGEEKPKKAVVDQEANSKRLQEIINAVKTTLKESKVSGKAPKWEDVVSILPKVAPEPLASGILKNGKLKRKLVARIDRSWTVVLNILKSFGEMTQKQKPEKVLWDVPAVEIGQGDPVTKKDVELVVGFTDSEIAA